MRRLVLLATLTLCFSLPALVYSVQPAHATTQQVTFRPGDNHRELLGVILPAAAAILSAQATEPVTPTATLTATAPVSPLVTPQATLTLTASVTASQAITAPSPLATPTPVAPVGPTSDALQEGPLAGTIIANRSTATIKFFVEGETYTVAPERSLGLNLPRVTAVLSLYNCDANTPETQAGCFWDPYVVQRDGFYEVVNKAPAGLGVTLVLQAANNPPANQVWVQNRTGQPEAVVFKNEVFELPPSYVQEFSVVEGAPAILYVRHCAILNDQQACEWSPKTLEPGVYYAIEAVETVGGLPGSQILTADLRPVVAQDGQQVAGPPEILCRLQVPVLNVRTGPGLQYQIIAKVRATDDNPGTVLVVGRDTAGEWLAVDQRVAPGGWVTAEPSYILCEGDIGTLPIAEITDGRLAPTPTPVPVTTGNNSPAPAAPEESSDVGNGAAEENGQTQPQTGPAIPEGLAVLVVNNAFQHQMRFTLDQQYRPEEGPSEYDLQPGESMTIVVFPGKIAFTASSPWNGLSGNAELEIDADASQTLWLRFEPDPDGSGRWNLHWQ